MGLEQVLEVVRVYPSLQAVHSEELQDSQFKVSQVDEEDVEEDDEEFGEVVEIASTLIFAFLKYVFPSTVLFPVK